MSQPHPPESPPTAPLPTGRTVGRLRRSRTDRVLFGVCGGLGRYLDIDPVVLRIVTVVLVLAGVGIPAYLVAWLVIPEAGVDEEESPAGPRDRHQTAVVLGGALVGLGALLLLRRLVPWFDTDLFWPLLVVAAGVLLVATARR